MNEADGHPLRDQRRLPCDDALQQRETGIFRAGKIGVVAGDDVIRQPPQGLVIAACGKILEGADADMACRDAGEDRAGQDGFAINGIAGQHRRQRPCGRHAERRHRFADDIFAQDRPKGCPPVAAPGKRCRPATLQLDIAALAVAADHLAEQDRAPVAKLRHELAELMAGIGHGQRLRPFGGLHAGKQRRQPILRDVAEIEAEFGGERPVDGNQARGGYPGRLLWKLEWRRQPRIGVIEGKHALCLRLPGLGRHGEALLSFR